MTMPWLLDWVWLLVVLLVIQRTWASTVYMDKYGDCNRTPYVEVNDDVYTILSQGGEAHDNLQCSITFRSIRNDRLCLTFKEFEITRRNVYLNVFSEQSASGKPMASYSKHTEGGLPDRVCSDGKYITVQLRKKELSRDGYRFNIELRERNEIADGLDAFIMSIGVIIGLIVGVIVLVVIIAVIVVYCCCNKSRHHGLVYRHTQKSSSRAVTVVTEAPIEPSAPPFPGEEEFAHGYHGNPPPAYTENPPPYPGAPPAEKVSV